MKIGISVCSTYHTTDVRAGAMHMVERTRAAREADLDSLFVGDHHITAQPYYQNTPILGRMLAEWHDKPAGALYLLPLWNPVLLAEQVATLAAIAPGRFILQCALGGGDRMSAGLGMDPGHRVGRFAQSLDLMQRLWAGERVSADGYWPVAQARIAPLPPQPIEVWVGATAAPAINRTARLAHGWLGSPGATLAQATAQLNVYRQACSEHGRQPAAVAVRRDFYVGSSAEAARRVVQPYVEGGYRGIDESALLTGSAEQVAEQIRAFESAGFTDIIVRNLVSEQSEALASIERLAEVKRLLR